MSDITDIINLDDRNDVIPPFASFIGQESYFPPGEAPLPTWVGWVVVVGFGLLFSVITTCLVLINKFFGQKGEITSEHFK
ncbi:MAG: hypothetical protein ACI8RD_013973 [Bacillariaceae sp.]|jgi:hypothetical protein